MIENILSDAHKIIAPSWPLQSIVAVNPFWNQRDRSSRLIFKETLLYLHKSMYHSFDYYLDSFNSGKIDNDILLKTFNLAKENSKVDAKSIEDFIFKSRNIKISNAYLKTYSEFIDDANYDKLLLNDFSKCVSSYFDNSQALVYEEYDNGFWSWWNNLLIYDKSLKIIFNSDCLNCLQSLDKRDSKKSIEKMLLLIGFNDDNSKSFYLKRLLSSVVGWASKFSHLEWEKGLGKSVEKNTNLNDCIAVRMAYDYILINFKAGSGYNLKSWLGSFLLNNISSCKSSPENSNNENINYLEIWQDSLELSYQKDLIKKIDLKKKTKVGKEIQMFFCIDVRSEIIRRMVEQENNKIETYGFAGFFGFPLSFQRCRNSKKENLLPVLLNPAFEIKEVDKKGALGFANAYEERQLTLSFLRCLRKGTLSSFTYVELFGCIAIERFLKRTIKILFSPRKKSEIPRRFKCTNLEPKLANKDTNIIIDSSIIAHSAQIISHMGLINNFSKLIVLTAHGSITTNNAFASSLDCGACGGHAGDISVRFIASLLNERSVRDKLKENHDIVIPKETIFVAAVHETVSDEIYLLDKEIIPDTHKELVNELVYALRISSNKTRKERYNLRSHNIDSNTKRRSYNWAETRPEWALAGNASFIVAPRLRTSGVNLEGRSFLHEYYWENDDNFKTLELIMTAPMLVTNWINMQYYASTVAPDIFGAGNKILHNIVNETGVIEGSSGDLKIGLPIQSVHDGEKFVHDPLKLSVFIEAPSSAIEEIVKKHKTVQELIDNEWVHLFQIDAEFGKINRRVPGEGIYLNY